MYLGPCSHYFLRNVVWLWHWNFVDCVWNVMVHAQKTDFVFRAKRTSPFKSVGASVQSTTGSRVVGINGSNAGYTMFRGSVKSTGYPLHSPLSPSLPLPCVTVCHHVSTGLYFCAFWFSIFFLFEDYGMEIFGHVGMAASVAQSSVTTSTSRY